MRNSCVADKCTLTLNSRFLIRIVFADLNTILIHFDLGGKSLNRKVFKYYNDILFNISSYIIY